jgi:hypothetical protein
VVPFKNQKEKIMGEQWLAWKTEGLEVDKPTIDFVGTWKNELKSEMDLEVNGNTVTGQYRTAVGAPGEYEEFDITGVINGDLISFIVSWGNYGSVTAWVGQHTVDETGGNELIETQWQLVKNIAEATEPKALWGDVITGSDVFTRPTKKQ